MDALKIFSNPKFGQVRIIDDDASGELLFCANDVTQALGYTNGRDAVLRHVEKDDVVKHDITDSLGRLQQATFVTESGVYSLIFSSKQERAKEFKHWVTSEVLPSIRKTGRYSVGRTGATLVEQTQAKLAFSDWAIRTLNLNAASRLLMARRIGETVGMQDTLPTAIDAGTQHPVTQTATELLRRHNVKISTVAFNRILERKGIVRKASRPSNVKGKTHTWMVLQPDFDKYGENQQDPNHQKQTQIRWYENSFGDILAAAGLARQAAMSL